MSITSMSENGEIGRDGVFADHGLQVMSGDERQRETGRLGPHLLPLRV